MAKKHMKRHSTSLTTREMQLKTTMGYNFTLIRMPVIKKKMMSVDKDVEETRTLKNCCWEYKLL